MQWPTILQLCKALATSQLPKFGLRQFVMTSLPLLAPQDRHQGACVAFIHHDKKHMGLRCSALKGLCWHFTPSFLREV